MQNSTTNVNYSELIKQMQLPESFESIVDDIFRPLAGNIIEQKKEWPLFVSINGIQGTGKSTMTTFLKHIIQSESGASVVALSLDDFYHTRKVRKELSEKIHPLLVTRGVPGTHDVELIVNTLDSLMGGVTCQLPKFSKAMDDRCQQSEWCEQTKPVDIILFEGWCNNSPAQDERALMEPVNELEQREDADGRWRQYVNDQLIDYHQRFYQHADMCIMLKPPRFEYVYEWRSLQEKKLRDSRNGPEQGRVMNNSDLTRFIQHYERISRHTLSSLPSIADIVLPMAADHAITGIVHRDVAAVSADRQDI